MARRGALFGCALAFALAYAPLASAQQIVPADFFSRIPSGTGGDMAVAADTMVFDSRTDTVVAQGNVGISFEGFRAAADRAIYYQTTGQVELVGNVAIVDPDGVEYVAERVELEDGFREGFLRALTVAFPDGSHFTAAETNFDEGVERVYLEGRYLPCGTCIDANGNRIGWSVRAARIVTDEAEQIIYFEQPSLELLGHSVISLPWLAMPADEDLELPVLSFDNQYGVGISLPFFRYPMANGRLAVTPSIYTNQGAGVALDWQQSVGRLDYTVGASGVVQLNPGAYSGVAERTFRGAIQTTGRFTATDEWTLGWSYTAFTDPAYMPDYRIASGTVRNQVYAQYLETDTYADIRVQQFLPLDDYDTWREYHAAREQQALVFPSALFDRIVDLEGDAGRIQLSGKLLGLSRERDHTGRGYVYGYEGQSVHAMAQGSWTNQYIAPGGLAVSPYLGMRLDGASVASSLGDNQCVTADQLDSRFCRHHPGNDALFSATPIAALEVRYPLLARMSGATHVIEPIVQLVYRDGPAVPGIVNNDSQSFVFDDTNLFSFNRFSGIDRQETGLRANVGTQFQTSFDNGGWLSALIGQSFHLAGTNGFNAEDGTPAGVGSGMNENASYIVGGVQGGFGGLSGGAKLQYDPLTGEIPRTQMTAAASWDGYRLFGNYVYIAENPELNSSGDLHEVRVGADVPLADYWTASAAVAWDLSTNQWLETTGSIRYDDSYLAYGINARATGPTHDTENDFRIAVNFNLRGPGRREIVGFDYQFTDF